jgi:hypothetical protein
VAIVPELRIKLVANKLVKFVVPVAVKLVVAKFVVVAFIPEIVLKTKLVIVAFLEIKPSIEPLIASSALANKLVTFAVKTLVEEIVPVPAPNVL